MKQFWRLLLIVVLGLYLLLLIFFTVSYFGYKQLPVDDHLKKSDIIVIYGTDDMEEKYKEASLLINKQRPKKVLITPFVKSGKLDSAAMMEKYQINKALVIPDYYSENMKESSVFISDEMTHSKYNDALFIANDYEMKRLIATFEKYDRIHFVYNKSIKHDQNSKQYKEKAQQEIWNLPKLWFNL